MTTRKRKKSLLPQSESGSDQTDGEPLKRLGQCQSDTNPVHEQLSPYFSTGESVRLSHSFFSQPCADLARAFLGKVRSLEMQIKRLLLNSEIRCKINKST